MTRIIGIGIGEDPEKIIASIPAAGSGIRVVGYCTPETAAKIRGRVPLKESKTPEEDLSRDLFSGAIDAAVRGTLPANGTLRALKKAAGVDHLERIALLETAAGKKFLLTPVGVDEGSSVQEKIEFVRKGTAIAEKFGLPANVGILSGGRLGDIGRDKKVDRSMADAELVARITGAVHCEILIEDAIESCGVIIAPDGISGNLIFRTLTFLGNGKGHGAPVVNIDKIFVDTSRASPDYTNALLLAASLLD